LQSDLDPPAVLAHIVGMRLALLVGALTLACSSGADRVVPSSGPRNENGQTGSTGYVCTSADCAAAAQRTLDSLTQSSSSPTFVGASCHPPDTGPAKLDTRPTVFCRCDQSDGGFFLLSDVSPGVGCQVRGRGGFCIFDDNDFSGCDVTDPHSCDGVCATLESRLASDAAADHSAEIRFSGCVSSSSSSPSSADARCRLVLQVDDQCFTNLQGGGAVLETEPVDCALSDEEIVSPGSGIASDGGAVGAASDASPQP
jgi:hypothetical protein